MELNVQEWKEFKLSDYFDVNGSTTTKLDVLIDEYGAGNYPYVTTQATNNGVAGYYNCFTEEGNILVADSAVAGYVSYQPYNFSASDHVEKIIPKCHFNKYIAMFLVTILNCENYRYSYGRKFNQDNIRNTTIKLPAKLISPSNYVPDWQFMEDYIKSLHHKSITTQVKANSVKEFDIDSWEEFKVSEIFTLLNGKGITKEEIEENKGTFVAVQSGEENNGVLGKIDKQYCIKMGYTLTDKMCLTVARTGSAGFVSFQSTGCVVGDSAKILLLDDSIATVNIYLFLQTILTANRFKYDYGRKVTEDKYLADIIKLPIKKNDDGKPIIDNNHAFSDKGYIPDWLFMEDFINSLPYSDRIQLNQKSGT